MADSFKIRVRHTDGSTTRRYKTQAAAVARFEEMVGYPIVNAIAEQYHAVNPPPAVEQVRYVHAVTDVGGTVEFIRVIDRFSGEG